MLESVRVEHSDPESVGSTRDAPELQARGNCNLAQNSLSLLGSVALGLAAGLATGGYLYYGQTDKMGVIMGYGMAAGTAAWIVGRIAYAGYHSLCAVQPAT